MYHSSAIKKRDSIQELEYNEVFDKNINQSQYIAPKERGWEKVWVSLRPIVLFMVKK